MNIQKCYYYLSIINITAYAIAVLGTFTSKSTGDTQAAGLFLVLISALCFGGLSLAIFSYSRKQTVIPLSFSSGLGCLVLLTGTFFALGALGAAFGVKS